MPPLLNLQKFRRLGAPLAVIEYSNFSSQTRAFAASCMTRNSLRLLGSFDRGQRDSASTGTLAGLEEILSDSLRGL